MWKLIVLVLLLLFCLNCTENDSASSNNKKSIVLKIHAWEGYVREYEPAFIAHMKKNHSMNVELQITNTSGLDSFIEAISNKDVHLISPANDLLAPLLRDKLIQPVDRKRIKKFNQINPIILETNFYNINGKTYAVPFTFGPYAIAYNKDKMKPPTSYSVFWNPKYRKKVSISSEYDTANIYMTALMLGISGKDIFNLNNSQLRIIEIKLRQLCRQQIAEYWEDNLNPLSYNKLYVGTDWGVGVNQINKKYNGNWGLIIPEEGATAWIDSWVMTKNINNIDVEKTAYAFIDYMLSPKVQAQVAQVTSYGPTNPYAGRYLNAKEKEQYYLIDPEYLKKLILWKPLSKEILKKYQDVWRRAKR